MAMRMPPQQAAQPLLPEVDRGTLVFFLGFALIVTNFYVTNLSNGNNPLEIIFTRGGGSAAKPFVGLVDTGLQVLGLALLVLLAQYGGEGAGGFALLFVLALWLLFLVVHLGGLGTPAAPSNNTNTQQVK